MSDTFTLAACAEMLWRDRPMEWRLRRLTEMGFQVGLWNWPDHDLAMLEKSGATFSIMNGYLRGRLSDDEGAAELLKTARRRRRSASASASRGSICTAPAWAMAACRSRPARRSPARCGSRRATR